MVFSNSPGTQSPPPSGGAPSPMNTWQPMVPQYWDAASQQYVPVSSHNDFEHHLRGGDEVIAWLDTHPHFIPAIFSNVEKLILQSHARFLTIARLVDVFDKLALMLSRDTNVVSAKETIMVEGRSVPWLEAVQGALSMVKNEGTPNTRTDDEGKIHALTITETLDLTTEGLHAKDFLEGHVQHNHQTHVDHGWAYHDPQTHAYLTQYGVSHPTGFDGSGQATGYGFTPHDQYAPWGQQGYPPQPPHGGHGQTGSGSVGLLSKLTSAAVAAL